MIFEYVTPASPPILSYANPQDPEPQAPGQYSGTGQADGAHAEAPAAAPASSPPTPAPDGGPAS